MNNQNMSGTYVLKIRAQESGLCICLEIGLEAVRVVVRQLAWMRYKMRNTTAIPTRLCLLGHWPGGQKQVQEGSFHSI